MTRSREEMRSYQRERRARLATDESPEGVTTGVTPPDSGNTVRAGVRTEIDSLADRGEGRPGLAAAALRLAELLDDDRCQPQHPTAAARLRELLAELRAAQPTDQRSRLAQIRAARLTPPGGMRPPAGS